MHFPAEVSAAALPSGNSYKGAAATPAILITTMVQAIVTPPVIESAAALLVATPYILAGGIGTAAIAVATSTGAVTHHPRAVLPGVTGPFHQIAPVGMQDQDLGGVAIASVICQTQHSHLTLVLMMHYPTYPYGLHHPSTYRLGSLGVSMYLSLVF